MHTRVDTHHQGLFQLVLTVVTQEEVQSIRFEGAHEFNVLLHHVAVHLDLRTEQSEEGERCEGVGGCVSVGGVACGNVWGECVKSGGGV